MTLLIIGLLLFLGLHSIRIFADVWRSRQVALRGEGVWKGAFSLLALLGLALIVRGYGDARATPVAIGLAAYLGFAIYMHPLLIGVRVW